MTHHNLTGVRSKVRSVRLTLDTLGDNLSEALSTAQLSEVIGVFAAVERSIGEIGGLLRATEAGGGETVSTAMKSDLRCGLGGPPLTPEDVANARGIYGGVRTEAEARERFAASQKLKK